MRSLLKRWEDNIKSEFIELGCQVYPDLDSERCNEHSFGFGEMSWRLRAMELWVIRISLVPSSSSAIRIDWQKQEVRWWNVPRCVGFSWVTTRRWRCTARSARPLSLNVNTEPVMPRSPPLILSRPTLSFFPCLPFTLYSSLCCLYLFMSLSKLIHSHCVFLSDTKTMYIC